jgi:hypothetical protein
MERPWGRLEHPGVLAMPHLLGKISETAPEDRISTVAGDDVRAEIRGNRARKERKLAVCSGSLSLTPEDRAELMVILAEDVDGDIAVRAARALMGVTPQTFAAAVGRADADERLFDYCSSEMADQPGIADALAKNSKCPRDLIARAAQYLTSAGVQAILDDLNGLSLSLELAEALASCPHATTEQRDLIAELNSGVPEEKAVEEATKNLEIDASRRRTLIQKISGMNVVQRIQLAIKGPREARTALIRDSNKIIQRAVLQSPRLTETDVENYAGQTNLSADVLRLISMNRNFMKDYIIVRNLSNNPKTPLDISLRLLVRLTPTDLKKLSENKNIPETLRSSANKLIRARTTKAAESE